MSKGSNKSNSLSHNIFICYGTRNRDLASAFEALIKEASGDMLECFVAHDIEPGMYWNDEILKALKKADAVVTLLTADSYHRPWLHFEAGVAQGLCKRNYGIALGIRTEQIENDMPFKLRALCEGDSESLRRIVALLVNEYGKNCDVEPASLRIPVDNFRKRVPKYSRRPEYGELSLEQARSLLDIYLDVLLYVEVARHVNNYFDYNLKIDVENGNQEGIHNFINDHNNVIQSARRSLAPFNLVEQENFRDFLTKHSPIDSGILGEGKEILREEMTVEKLKNKLQENPSSFITNIKSWYWLVLGERLGEFKPQFYELLNKHYELHES